MHNTLNNQQAVAHINNFTKFTLINPNDWIHICKGLFCKQAFFNFKEIIKKQQTYKPDSVSRKTGNLVICLCDLPLPEINAVTSLETLRTAMYCTAKGQTIPGYT